MNSLLAIGIGGALGAILRYKTVLIASKWLGSGFPFGTMLVNGVGSFVMGIAFYFVTERGGLPDALRDLLMVGLLGAFTTYSTFAVDALVLMQQHQYTQAFIYIFGSALGSVAMAWAGLSIAKLLLGHQ